MKRPCSACVDEATINVHRYDLCDKHGRGMVFAVLSGEKTPVGYIIAAACGEDEPLNVSAPETSLLASFGAPANGPGFMRHGAIPALPLPKGASTKSGCPQPLRAQVFG